MLWKDIELRVEQVYNDYGKLIFSIAYQKLQDYQLAEDATQETIMKLIKHPRKMNELESDELRNYIAKVASNTGYDFLKKAKKDNLNGINKEEILNQDTDNASDVEEFVITKSSIENMKAEIRNLDDKYSSPLVLHKLHGHTISEVSELLSVPERTVKYRINKAIKMLKEVLEKGDDSDE